MNLASMLALKAVLITCFLNSEIYLPNYNGDKKVLKLNKTKLMFEKLLRVFLLFKFCTFFKDGRFQQT